jgi:hypothetical protein
MRLMLLHVMRNQYIYSAQLYKFLTENLQKLCMSIVNSNTESFLASSSMGTGTLFPWVNWPGIVADNLPLSSAEIKNEWIRTSTLPIYLRGVYRNDFTFTLLVNAFWIRDISVGVVLECGAREGRRRSVGPAM